MLKKYITVIFLSFLTIAIISLFVNSSNQKSPDKNKVVIQQAQVVQETQENFEIPSSNSDENDAISNQVAEEDYEAWCDNSDEVKTFEKPIPIIWFARMNGCLESCQGASFTKVDQNEEYPRFAGYYPDTNGEYFTEEWNPIPEKFQEKGLILRIEGDWLGIEEDHPQTVFGGKCVPIVNIRKIEIIK